MPSRILSRRFLRLSVCLLVGAGLSVLILVPNHNERVQGDLRRTLETGLDQTALGLGSTKKRERLINLFDELRRQGDDRGAARLAPIFWKSDLFTRGELTRIIEIAFIDIGTWNTVLPDWKKSLLERWVGTKKSADSPLLLDHLQDKVEVTFEFSSPPGRYKKLFLSGNWTENGEMGDLEGWTFRPMVYDGRWSRTEKLGITFLNRRYHAVVRTEPWPRGRPVGSAVFMLRKSEKIIMAPLDTAPPREPSTAPPKKRSLGVSLLCLDGASWHVAIPLIQQGRLPNFARLLNGGSVATLSAHGAMGGHYDSTPNIYSALTGKIPFRHGMGASEMALNFYRRSNPIWKMAADGGKSAAAVSVFGTFPAEPFPGKIVTEAYFGDRIQKFWNMTVPDLRAEVIPFARQMGMSEKAATNLLLSIEWIGKIMATTYPDSLARELDAVLPAPTRRAGGMMQLAEIFDTQVTAVVKQLVRWEALDFLCVYLTSTDTTGHRLWNGFEPGPAGSRGEREEFVDAYVRADRLIGFLLDNSQYLVLFSDHGFGPAPRPVIKSLNPEKLLEIFLPARNLKTKQMSAYGGSEWAVMFPAKVPAHIQEGFVRFLEEARYSSGRRPFSGVRQETIKGAPAVRFHCESPADIWGESIILGGASYAAVDLFEVSSLPGVHMGNGMFALAGPGIKARRLEGLMYPEDITPTILYLLGLPIATDMDGRLLSDIFNSQRLAENPPLVIDSYGKEGNILWRFLRAIRWDAVETHVIGLGR